VVAQSITAHLDKPLALVVMATALKSTQPMPLPMTARSLLIHQVVTAGSLNCTDPSRDDHDFFNYGVTPPTGSTIVGIEIRLDGLVDLVKNSAAFCVQLSSDGGATWTTAKTTTGLTTTNATYILGGATDTWGRTWTPVISRTPTSGYE